MKLETAETRQRILDAAATVFAEHGFASTTTRMICSRAQVNVAAVNYHFGSKEALYHEVLRYTRRQSFNKYPVDFGLRENALPEEKLYAFVYSFLLRNFDNESNTGFGILTMREMVSPTSALDMIIEESIRSLFGQLLAIVRSIMGEDTAEELVQACSRSTIGQCVFYLFSRSVINRMMPEQKFTHEDIKMIAYQITSYTLNALRGFSGKKV